MARIGYSVVFVTALLALISVLPAIFWSWLRQLLGLPYLQIFIWGNPLPLLGLVMVVGVVLIMAGKSQKRSRAPKN